MFPTNMEIQISRNILDYSLTEAYPNPTDVGAQF